MKQYSIEVDDTISQFLELVSEHLNKSVETIIEDGLFNQVASTEDMIKTVFSVEE